MQHEDGWDGDRRSAIARIISSCCLSVSLFLPASVPSKVQSHYGRRLPFFKLWFTNRMFTTPLHIYYYQIRRTCSGAYTLAFCTKSVCTDKKHIASATHQRRGRQVVLFSRVLFTPPPPPPPPPGICDLYAHVRALQGLGARVHGIVIFSVVVARPMLIRHSSGKRIFF